MRSVGRWRPELVVLVVGGIVGLVFAFVCPPWVGGADEPTHFARAVDVSGGQLVPRDIDGVTGSMIPRSFDEDQTRVGENLGRTSPWGDGLLGDLLSSRPDSDDEVVIDTQATVAASPVAYLPSAVAMAVPRALGSPGLVLLWAGRLGDLIAYLGLTVLAVRMATAFRWTIALAALVPMNLAIASSVTPDALTIGALFLVLGLWTRVWRPPGAVAGLAGSREPDDPSPVASTPSWRLAAWVGGASLLLALAKPPYFLVLVAFPALLVVRWRVPAVRVAAAVSMVAAAVGGSVALLTGSGSYKAVTVTWAETIVYQPDVQRRRLFGDPLGFLGRSVDQFVTNLPSTVRSWTTQIGFWRSDLPDVVPWLLLVAFVAAAMLLDRDDLLRLRRFPRAIWVVGCAAMILAIYASAYIYFDDSVEGKRISFQFARYAIPLVPLAIMGWAPRWLVRLGAVRRVPAGVPLLAFLGLVAVAVFAILDVWLSTGGVSG